MDQFQRNVITKRHDSGASPEEARTGRDSLEAILKKGYGDPRFYELLRHMAILHGAKNKDYAQGGKQGHLGNFTRVSDIKKLYPGFDWSSPFGTAIDYMLKQLDAAMILYSVNRESVTDENIPERLQDVAIYSGIATLLWQDEQTEQVKLNANAERLIKLESHAVNCQKGKLDIGPGEVLLNTDKAIYYTHAMSVSGIGAEQLKDKMSERPERPATKDPTLSCNICGFTHPEHLNARKDPELRAETGSNMLTCPKCGYSHPFHPIDCNKH